MKSLRVAAIATLAIFILSTSSNAREATYIFDKQQTKVRFCWVHLGITNICGYFREFDGQLIFNQAKLERSKLEITFQTGSIETSVPLLEDQIKGENVFDAKNYPTATFKSTKVEKTSEKTGKVIGELTMKGVTKEVVLDVILTASGTHPSLKVKTLGFGATTQLKRSEFNAGYLAPAVSDVVDLEIQAELNAKS